MLSTKKIKSDWKPHVPRGASHTYEDVTGQLTSTDTVLNEGGAQQLERAAIPRARADTFKNMLSAPQYPILFWNSVPLELISLAT